ncbi:GntR family transcriptional regulator [Aestuariibius sp. HNIBRBA575]|uniref:GntR family transcriptional regulator n=1 Tax=Aestuariibius sp. HNIBRBA575 TaxID=3233343 RepID=UPI0034A52E19
MARTNTRFITAHGQMLTHCDQMKIGQFLPSENALATQFGVSRTVIRHVLAKLNEQGIIALNGREKVVTRRSVDDDQLAMPESLLTIEELEGRFLDWVLRMDVPPGTVLNIAQLSKNFTVAAHTLQEFFSSLSRFGIVARRPRGGWVLLGFTAEYAVELSDFRTVLELNSVRHLVTLSDDHPIWIQLAELKQQHLSLLDRIDVDYHDFSQLDETFHEAINGVVTNRFVKEFQKVISLVFHYHFQWNKADERIRNEDAIREHLAYIDALMSRNADRAVAAAQAHLTTSKLTLLNSLKANAHAL